MNKYINSEKLIAEIEFAKSVYSSPNRVVHEIADAFRQDGRVAMCDDILKKIDSLQQEQPIEGKQVIIITETNGDANIRWDCRSLDDVMALLASAKSFIADKQIEELRGQGSGPDYNTTEGRFRNAHKFQQEQPEVDLAIVIEAAEEYAGVNYDCETETDAFYHHIETEAFKAGADFGAKNMLAKLRENCVIIDKDLHE